MTTPSTRRRSARTGPPRRRGVTLVELVVALGLTTVVMAAATSVMFVASRALPGPSDAVVRATEATLALGVFEAEAQTAIATRTSATGFLIRVPDRTGDTIPENITYTWLGTPGNALTRHDGVTTSTIVANVQDAQFEWKAARGSPTRLGTLYLTLTLERGLVLRSAVRLPSEPENNL